MAHMWRLVECKHTRPAQATEDTAQTATHLSKPRSTSDSDCNAQAGSVIGKRQQLQMLRTVVGHTMRHVPGGDVATR